MAQVLERRLEEAWIKEGVRLDLQGEDGYAFGRHSVRFVCMHPCTYVLQRIHTCVSECVECVCVCVRVYVFMYVYTYVYGPSR